MAKLQNNNHIRYFSSKQISKPQKERGHKALHNTPKNRPNTPYLYTGKIPPSDTQKPLKHPSNALKTPLISSNVTFSRLNTIQTTLRCNTNVTRMSHLVFPFSSLKLT